MSEIKRYEAIYDGNYIASHRAEYTNGQYVLYTDHARVVAELRAALAKAEAERDALKQDIEDRDRAIESLQLKVDTAHAQIDAMNARAERLAALVCAIDERERCLRHESPTAYIAAKAPLDAARAAVDAHGDLEVTP